VGVNLVSAADGLFTQCTDGPVGQCVDNTPPNYTGCTATNELAGTGMQIVGNTLNSCVNAMYGGGTGWLQMSGNVEPGEVMTISFVIWDTSDPILDSVVLLDDFVWSVTPSEPGVQPG